MRPQPWLQSHPFRSALLLMSHLVVRTDDARKRAVLGKAPHASSYLAPTAPLAIRRSVAQGVGASRQILQQGFRVCVAERTNLILMAVIADLCRLSGLTRNCPSGGQHRVAALADLYHARWGVEEMCKVSKQFLEIEQFHSGSERLVKQELFAHFNLLAMTPLLTNSDAAFCEAAAPGEGLLLRHSAYVSETLERICEWIGTGRRQRRPNRSYPRRSLRPASKWDRRRASAP